jgi:tetratricopeptide (TPR) repeat protein
MGRWNEAIESHKQATRLKANYAGAYFNLGYAYLQIGDRNAALEQYKVLQTLNPELAKKLYALISQKPVRQTA